MRHDATVSNHNETNALSVYSCKHVFILTIPNFFSCSHDHGVLVATESVLQEDVTSPLSVPTRRSRVEPDAMGRAVAPRLKSGMAAREASSPSRETHC